MEVTNCREHLRLGQLEAPIAELDRAGLEEAKRREDTVHLRSSMRDFSDDAGNGEALGREKSTYRGGLRRWTVRRDRHRFGQL
jgi:hypothetical protein